MNSPPQFNALPLLSVKPGLDEALGKVSQALEQFFAGNDTESLQTAIDELHRMSGVLQMLSLDGVIAYCGELEKLLQEFAEGVLQPTPVHQASIRRALFALTHYLDSLADGAPNTTLRLFNQYQEILQARGIETAFEVDLFFPDLNVELPEWVQEIPLQDDAQAHVRNMRSQYQQSLLKWLRNDNAADALQTMRTAVLGAMGCADIQQRAFWWVAGGLLDCLIYDGLPPELNPRKMLGRIDLQMKALADGAESDTVGVLCEMLYLVARSHAVSDTVDEIKRVYALDAYLPEEPPLPPSEVEEVLEQLRASLKVMEESWDRCVRDESEACKQFGQQTGELYSLSERLDRNTLQFLCKQIHNISAHTDEPDRAQRVALDMAMALLLAASGVEHYTHLGSGFQEQARILGQRMQAAITSQPEDAQHLEQLVGLHCQMEERDVMGTLATEMQNNMQHVEQGLNAFFENFEKRNELEQLARLLGQVQGGMSILSLDIAGQLVAVLRKKVEQYAEGTNPSPVEMRTIATAISAADSYVHDLAYGQKPDNAALESVMQSIQTAEQQTAGEATQKRQAVAAAAAAAEVPVSTVSEEDSELLEVFLEEAKEVLEILRANLEISQLHPDSQEPITVMRRGFHTLKGSGRMVGLDELGEVAWAIERAMNYWLKEENSATPALLKFIAKAADKFQTWIEELNTTGAAHVDGAELIELAEQFENGVEPLSLLQPAAEAPPEVVSEPEVEPESEAVKEEPVEPEVAIEPEFVMPELEAESKTESKAEPEFVVPEIELEAEAKAEPEEIELEEAGEPGAVVVGSVSLSPSLFNIATEEAAGHLAALRQHFNALRESKPPVVPYDFMRAAHTLAGVNRTMGFQMVADLAYALEQWLEVRIDKPFTLSEEQIDLVDQTITMLDGMLLDICNHQEPEPQPEIIARLHAQHEVLVAAEGVAKPAEGIDRSEQKLEAEPVLEAEPIEAVSAENVVPEEPATAVRGAPASEAQKSEPAQPAKEEAPRMRQMVDERRVRDDIDEQLLPIFLEESEDLYPQIGTDLRGWREQPDKETLGSNLQRLLHTLKGSARMAGVMRLGELTHRMEDRVIAAMAKAQRDAALFDELDNYFDRIGNVLEQLRSGEVAEPPAAEVVSPEAVAAAPMLELGAERAIFAAMLRVRSDTVDHLVNEAGEISVARSRIETELRNFRNGLLDLTDSINRLRQQLREIEIQAESQMEARGILAEDMAEKFDPLEFDRFTRFQELTRFMGESVHDVQTVQQTLLKNLDETAAALSAQAYLNRDLQQSLMVIRMVPFSSISERLYRIVRQTSKELGKKANLELVGSEVELDRSVLERMTAPFEHLLRNAVAHGLESTERRAELDKPAIGEIRVALSQESNEVVFDFSDDGVGLDMASLRQRAIEHGLVGADEQLSDEQTMQLIFSSGISTAAEVTEIAGRGVGMDVVRSEITALGGRIDVSSESGKGTHFRIHLPLTLAVTQVLMIQSGQDTYAVPSVMVEQVLQLKPAALEEAYQRGNIEWHGRDYPLRYLPHLLGDSERVLESQLHNPVLLLRSGEQRIALHVDALQGNQETVVKNIGPQLARLTGVAGATVLGSGRVVLILNPVMLKQRIPVAAKEEEKATVAEEEQLQLRPLVMVVDDSLTVRKITSRMLTRAGYEVITAKDGVDALEQLTQSTPSVILLDVEMPRMDGFEFTKQVRSDPKIKHLPIIMITSRTADKHRNYAMELGVNAYFGKPYQEDELLAEIASYVSVPEMV